MSIKNHRNLLDFASEGGCAAKLTSSTLAEMFASLDIKKSTELLAGIDDFEDASVFKLSDQLAVIQSVDFFPPMIDDPYIYGQIAAANALSDIFAMGGLPSFALNIVGFPICNLDHNDLTEILLGGTLKVEEAGAVIAGGHSISLDTPIYGLSVTGIVEPSKIIRNSTAQTGDKLILTKPLGTGIGLTGLRAGEIPKSVEKILLNSMCQLNLASLQVALKYKVNAMTDITGFGLIGHLLEMLVASNKTASIYTSNIPIFPEIENLAKEGFNPLALYTNRTAFADKVKFALDIELFQADILFDPQTSGGLLLSVDAADADSLLHELKQNDLESWLIGHIESAESKVSNIRVMIENE